MISSRPARSRRAALLLLGAAAGALALAPGARADDAAAAAAANKIIYRIRTDDKLSIHVEQEDDLSIIARVDANGQVNLPLVNQVRLLGQTLEQAQRTIENAYHDERFLRHPQVIISVEEYAEREVTIQGCVRAPARYPIPIDTVMNLRDLITKAGGLTDTARGSDVRVTRILPDGTVKVFHVNVEGVLHGRDSASAAGSSIELEPDDIVYVPERII